MRANVKHSFTHYYVQVEKEGQNPQIVYHTHDKKTNEYYHKFLDRKQAKALAEAEKKITPEQVAEIMAERKKKKQEEGMAKTYAEFLALGIKRGYGNPKAWAMIRIKARKHG